MDEAIQKIESGLAPLLLLANLDASGIRPEEACRALKLTQQFEDIPVVLYGNRSPDQLEALKTHTRANEILRRPFRVETLIRWIRVHLLEESESAVLGFPASAPSRPSTFPPTLPGSLSSSHRLTPPKFQKDKILVVDDEFLARTLMRDLLEGDGYHVETAEDWDSFRQSLLEHSFAAVLLDIGLPELSGDKLALFIDKFVPSPRPRVILHSGKEERELAAIAKRVGAFAYLTKSTGNSRIRAVVARAVQAYQARTKETA